jgi:hypothetical protein
LTNRNKQPFWQTRPRITKAQEKFLREYRRNVPVSRTPEAPTAYPSRPLAERQAREQREEQWRQYEALRSQVEAIEARPGARTSIGWIDPSVVSREEAGLISEYESQQPQEQTRWEAMTPIVTPIETAAAAIPRTFEATAETGLSASQALFGAGPRFPAILPFGPSEESLERSRESMRDIGGAITGQRGISETFRSLVERHGERPFGEQIVSGAVFDPLNLLPGIGFGPDIVRGLRALGKTRPAVTAALRETIQRAPKTLAGTGDAMIRTLDQLGERAPTLRRMISDQVGRIPGGAGAALRVRGIRPVAGGAIRTATGETPARITKFVEPALQKRFKDVNAAVENVGYKMDAFAGIRDDEYFIVLQRPEGHGEVSRMSEGLQEFTLRERPRVPLGERVPDRLSFKTFDDVDNFLKTGEYTRPDVTFPVRKGPFKKTYETVKPVKPPAPSARRKIPKPPDFGEKVQLGVEARYFASTAKMYDDLPESAQNQLLTRVGVDLDKQPTVHRKFGDLSGDARMAVQRLVRGPEGSAVAGEMQAAVGRAALQKNVDRLEQALKKAQNDIENASAGVRWSEGAPFELVFEFPYAMLGKARRLKPNIKKKVDEAFNAAGLDTRGHISYGGETVAGTRASLRTLGEELRKIEGFRVHEIGPNKNILSSQERLATRQTDLANLQDEIASARQELGQPTPDVMPVSPMPSKAPEALWDDFTEGHLQAWLSRSVRDEERDAVEAGIKRYIEQDPVPLERGDGWPAIRNLAEREGFIAPKSPVPEEVVPPVGAMKAPTRTTADPAAAPVVVGNEAEVVATKWSNAKARHGPRARKDLADLENKGYDTSEAEAYLDEFEQLERSDYDAGADGAQDFSEARTDAWDRFVSSLDEIPELDIEELIVPPLEGAPIARAVKEPEKAPRPVEPTRPIDRWAEKKVVAEGAGTPTPQPVAGMPGGAAAVEAQPIPTIRRPGGPRAVPIEQPPYVPKEPSVVSGAGVTGEGQAFGTGGRIVGGLGRARTYARHPRPEPMGAVEYPRAKPLEPREAPSPQELVEAGRGTYGAGTELDSGRIISGPGRGSGETPYRDSDAMFQDGIYPESDPFMATWKSKGSRVLEEVYDRNFPLKELEKQSGISAHQYAQLVPGAMGAGEDTVRRLYKPIIDSLRSADLPLLEKYMVLMRGGDIIALNPHALLPGGITNAERLRLLEEMPAKIGARRFRAIKKAADDIWAASGHGYGDPDLKPVDGNILELVNEGIISKEMYRAMKADHPHYIPWQRADFDISDFIEKSFSAKPEANLSTTGIRKMAREGSTRALSDPLNKLLAEPYRIKTIIFRNRAAKSIVRALEEIQRQTGEELVRYIDPKREMRIVERVTGERIPRKVKGEISQQWETISFFEDGVKNRVQVPSVYGRVAKGLEAEPSSGLVRIVSMANAPLRYGATTFNPLFLPKNIIRDGMSAMFREKVFPFIGEDYLRGVWAVIRKDALYSDAAQAGALVSGQVEVMNPTRFRIKATKATENGRLGLMGAITIPARATWKAIAAPFRLIEQVNILAERGVRVGVFSKLRNEGVESLEAAIRSRDATVDFAKSGNAMRTINALIPFTNAAVQGQANILRTIMKHPGRSAAFASMFASAAITVRVNNMRFETSSLIPDYEYTRNWIVQWAEGRRKDGTRYPLYFRIPKGEIAAIATFVPELLMHLARKDEDRSVVEIFLDQGFEVAKIISPIDIGEATGAMPPFLETATGLQFGARPFTKTPIVPIGEKDLPPEQQFGDRTSTLAVQLGQQFKVSPRKIDFALRDVAAGTGQQVSWLVSMALEALTGRPPELGIDDPDADVRAEGMERLSQTNPFVKAFVGTRDTQLDRRGYSDLDTAKTATQRVFGALPDVSRLGVKLGVVGSTIEGVDLTPQQRAEYQGMMGAEVVRELETFIYNPEFQALEDIEKEKHIRTALRIGKRVVSDIMGIRIRGQQPADTPPVTTTPAYRPSTLTPEMRQKAQDSLSRTNGGSIRGTTQGQSLKERAREIVGAR